MKKIFFFGQLIIKNFRWNIQGIFYRAFLTTPTLQIWSKWNDVTLLKCAQFFSARHHLVIEVIEVHWTGNTFDTSWDPDSWGVRPGYAFKLFPPSCHQETNVESQNKSHRNQRGKRMAEQGDLFEIQGSYLKRKLSYGGDMTTFCIESQYEKWES